MPAVTLEEGRMATVLFVVKATIAPEREAAFNRWYSEEHCPQFLRFPGAVSARRYRAILGEDRFQYMAVYEVQDEATFQRFLESEHFTTLKAEYDAHFGGASERARFAYVQVWP
jgi:antibiotic biosynthesis monooxygenase (ABM) superfamily enzyme